MRKVRFGILGCGHIGRKHAEAIQSLSDEAELVAVADCISKLACAFACEYDCNWYTDLGGLLSDSTIDAVCICTPSGLHAAQAIDVLTAGKHAVIEKPVDISLQAIDTLALVQSRTRRKIAVISQHRFDRANRIVHDYAHRGVFGHVTLASAQVHWWRPQAYYDSAEWRGTRSADGGCLMNQAIHMVDLLQWIMGPIAEVQSFTSTLAHTQIDVEDTAVALLLFANGALGMIEATTTAYPGGMSRLEIHGDHGSATIENHVLTYLHTISGDGEETSNSPCANNQAQDILRSERENVPSHLPSGVSAHLPVAHRAQLLDFVQAIVNEREPLVNLEEGRKAVEIVQAIYSAGRERRSVPLHKVAMVGNGRGSGS